MLTRRSVLSLSGLAVAVVAAGAGTAALVTGNAEAGPQRVFAKGGAAIRGFDPVAYHREGRPVEGSPEITTEWEGAVWRFATPENRAAFVADPQRYAPAFGGYCAWAVSQGYTAPIDPEAWDIVDGQLYLNYSRSVQETWQEDRAAHIAAGHRNWPGVLD